MLQSELNTAPAASIERPAGLTLSDELIQDIRNMPPLSRPAPKTYIAPEAIAEHLGHFDEGAARFMTDTNLQKYGIGQRDGTAFVIPAAEANALEAAAAGSATKLEKALGLPDGLLQNNNLVRVDIPRPRELDLRMPSGNEAWANSQWIPGGRLPGGGREAVISVGRLQAGQYSTRVVAGRGGNPQIGNVEMLPSGAGMTKLDIAAEKAYQSIREARMVDVATVAENTGLSLQEVSTLKKHLFFGRHEYPIDGTTVMRARFVADHEIGYAWATAAKGPLTEGQSAWFKQLARHELAERGFMAKGVPYLQREAWTGSSFGTTPPGAHNLAPKPPSTSFPGYNLPLSLLGD